MQQKKFLLPNATSTSGSNPLTLRQHSSSPPNRSENHQLQTTVTLMNESEGGGENSTKTKLKMHKGGVQASSLQSDDNTYNKMGKGAPFMIGGLSKKLQDRYEATNNY